MGDINEMIIRTPASSANLGPGFDSMGIAWKIYNTVRFEKSDELKIDGCDPRFRGPDNLAYASYLKALELCGIKEEPLHISFEETSIPISRGLGSSAALISAGAAAADSLFGLGLGKEGICRISCSVEGHPDNIVPSVFGGFQIASMRDDEVYRANAVLSSSWKFCVMVPDFELSTSEARRVLPASYTRAEAVFNISRAGLLVKALEAGDPDMLRYAQNDAIHQPYRMPLINGYETARNIAENTGSVSMCISGAGPTLLCTYFESIPLSAITEEVSLRLPGWKVLDAVPDYQGLIVM